jgi:hypothetical protein
MGHLFQEYLLVHQLEMFQGVVEDLSIRQEHKDLEELEEELLLVHRLDLPL